MEISGQSSTKTITEASFTNPESFYAEIHEDGKAIEQFVILLRASKFKKRCKLALDSMTISN